MTGINKSPREVGNVWSTLHLLYRGPLSSCNYACSYCPFAKHRSSREELEEDRSALYRFEAWIGTEVSDQRVAILFTPWGEALTRPWYREVIRRLSHAPNVVKVAVQTNLSASLDWLEGVDPRHLGLWTTFHPGQVSIDRFLARCERLIKLQVRFSVGVVGLQEHLPLAEELRTKLPPFIYVWVNAYKDGGPTYYSEELVERFSQLDPLFELNRTTHRSFGRRCHTGTRAFSVDGRGDVRRCHFVPRVRGNIYRDPIDAWAEDSPCSAASCGCHIGYVHLEHLQQYRVYGDGLAERIPEDYG